MMLYFSSTVLVKLFLHLSFHSTLLLVFIGKLYKHLIVYRNSLIMVLCATESVLRIRDVTVSIISCCKPLIEVSYVINQ